MDTDIHFTQGDSSGNMPVNITVGHAHECGNVALAGDSIPENSYISNVHVDTATETGAITEQDSIATQSQGHSRTQPSGNEINHEYDCGNFDEIVLPAISEEMHLSDLPVITAIETGSVVNFDGPEVPGFSRSQGPLCLLTTLETKSCDEEGKANPDDVLDPNQMLDPEADPAHETDAAYPTDEDETREDFDHQDLPSSQPPSSSPPQLFSSSPCASSQSSAGDIEPLKTADVKLDISQSVQDSSHTEAVQDKSHLASVHLHEQDIIISTASAEHHVEMNPALGCESPGPSKKRVGYQSDDDLSDGPLPAKRSKSGSHLYPPPAPMRATLASQSRQFKKLAAPFRPPSKLPVARDEPVQNTKNVIESAELNHDKPDQKPEPSMHILRPHHKNSNTSRFTQFKSPLVHRVPSAHTRTIRLTPALQALERKLQLLKRAVKVKEDNEEEVLTRLADKWVEAGREVAYEVWDATKDTGNFEEKAILARRSYGWENTNNRNTSWGWDTKHEDAGEESRAPDSSMAVRAADPLDAEEDGAGFHNTLGTMLRQLGIAPEIFGWDDDKEAFCD